MLMLDTRFLIDYQRESKSRRPEAVHRFLEDHRDTQLQMSLIAWGEFLAGFADESHPFIAFAWDHLEVQPLDPKVAVQYRKAYRQLKGEGRLIGGNDLWIAAHALAADRPLVTRNDSDFARVPGLRLIVY